MEVTNYDYDGMSFQILAERRGPYAIDEDLDEPAGDRDYRARYVGDRFLSTYLHGPLGPVARTAELDNNDVSDNRDHYYLRDAMGGHLGLIVDDDGDVSTPGHAAFTTYDAFGNAMTERTLAAGAFAWRGGEGSVTEREPDLVYMQARHYSPKIGRFIQADTMLLSGMTTQGFNRYAYAQSDPANTTDATGMFVLPAIIIIGGLLLLWALSELLALIGVTRCGLWGLSAVLGFNPVFLLLSLILLGFAFALSAIGLFALAWIPGLLALIFLLLSGIPREGPYSSLNLAEGRGIRRNSRGQPAERHCAAIIKLQVRLRRELAT